MFKTREKNRSVNLRFEIFIMAFNSGSENFADLRETGPRTIHYREFVGEMTV